MTVEERLAVLEKAVGDYSKAYSQPELQDFTGNPANMLPNGEWPLFVRQRILNFFADDTTRRLAELESESGQRDDPDGTLPAPYIEDENGTRLLHIGPAGAVLDHLRTAVAQSIISVQGPDDPEGNPGGSGDAGFIVTSGSAGKMSHMLYATEDQGLRFNYNYIQPDQGAPNGTHSDPAHRQVLMGVETDGAYFLAYFKSVNAPEGQYETGGKTLKIYPGGYEEGAGPHDTRGEYVSFVSGIVGRGFDFGTADDSPDDYKMKLRIKGGGDPNPIYLVVNGEMRNVTVDADGFLKARPF